MGRTNRATRAAGWLAIGVGAGHSVLAPLIRRDTWRRIDRRRPWRDISLEPGREELRQAEAFWFGPASFGVPVVAVGALVLSAERRGQPIPLGVGVTLGVWSTAMVVAIPRSPAWVLLASAALLTAGAVRS